MENRQLVFKKLELSDINRLRQTYLQQNRSRLCDWTVGGIWMWRDYFQMEYAEADGTLIFKLLYFGKITAFSFQMNENYSDIIGMLKMYAKQHEIPLVLCLVEEAFLKYIQEEETCLHIKEEADWFDYLYDAEKLRTYTGKHYATQRNHVNTFRRDYPACTAAEGMLDPAEAKAFLDVFYKDKEISGSIEQEEKDKTYEVFAMPEVYGFKTIALRLDGRLIAIAAGEIIGDTAFEHIEKAISTYNGIYPVISQEFARACPAEVHYINKEEDCGDLGLRYSKEKYRPVTKLSKYTVEICHSGE